MQVASVLVQGSLSVALLLLQFPLIVRGEEVRQKHTLYLLSMLPYRDPRFSVQPAFQDGADIIPVAYHAIELINNRTDILRDYHIELIESNGGCDIETLATETFVRNIFHSGKQIVGVIGPGCSDSSVTVSSLCSRSEIALITVHLGSTPLLADRTQFPYAFAASDTSFDVVNTILEILQYNKWKNVAVLYDVATLVFVNRFLVFQQAIQSLPDYNMVFSAAVFNPNTPLRQLRESFARIIIAFVGYEHICNLLCMASYEHLIYPSHQWVFVRNLPACYEDVDFTVLGERYQCTGAQQKASMRYVIAVLSTCFVPILKEDNMNGQNISSPRDFQTLQSCIDHRFYDGVWMLAFALNASINALAQNNLSLSNYWYGQECITQTIQQQFYELIVYGQTGYIRYDRMTGSRRYYTSFVQFTDEFGNAEYIGQYNLHELEVFDNSTFLPNQFPSSHIHLSEIAAAIAYLLSVIMTIPVVAAHVLTVVYRDSSSVKASSPKLNHFVFAGCYIIVLCFTVYTIIQTFQLGHKDYSILCNISAWCFHLGSTLILSTVCVKTWRLYDVFVLSSKHMRTEARFPDHRLAAFILALLSFDIVLCVVWVTVDPLLQETKNTLDLSGRNPEILTEYKCQSKGSTQLVVFFILMASKVILLTCSAYLAFLTRRIRIKRFKTTEVTRLVYSICLVCGVGIPIFYFSQHFHRRHISYTILCLMLIALVVLCLVFLFLPPLVPTLKQKLRKLSQIYCMNYNMTRPSFNWEE